MSHRLNAAEVESELDRARHLRANNLTAQAEAICKRILGEDNRCAGAWRELGACAVLGGRLQEAEHFLTRASEADPAADTLHDLGRVLLRRRRDLEAFEALQRAAAAAPARADILSDLGMALHRLGRLAQASDCYRQALVSAPASVATRSNLASALKDAGDFDAAVAQYEQAAALAPDDLGLLSNLLWTTSHQDELPAQALYARHRDLAHAFNALPRVHFSPEPGAAERPLRLGFVSADLRNHAVAFFLMPILRALDRKRFSIHAYAGNEATDATTAALKALCDGWVEAFRLDDAALAQRIRSDGIDILFDLSGHTAGNRLPVFARRAAPVQASWIGYPCTTGLAAMDYLLSDHHLAPPGAVGFTEKIVRLPAAVTFEPLLELPEVQPLPALQRGHLTLGSFHRPAKLTRRTLAGWAAMLRAVPTAQLLIAHCDDEASALAGRQMFSDQGVAPERLSFRPRLPLADYLALHHEVDIALDAFGFSGGTTTAHALFMGVPVLTVEGEAMPARQSAAMLRHVGLDEFVTGSAQAFVERGLHWSQRIDELASLRQRLRLQIRCLPLLQEAQVEKAFEAAALAMWRRFQAGQPPVALTVLSDGSIESAS